MASFIAMVFRKDTGSTVDLPWFFVAFILLMILRNTMPVPEVVLSAVNDASRFLLVVAISALGVKTSLQKLFAPGIKGLILIGLDTVFLLGQAIVFLHFFRS